jgi:formate hydrogenlyase subunit 3/multisubunit Na+/H+ antiporter MnhD subunit
MLTAFAAAVGGLLALAVMGIAGNRSAALVRLVYGATGLLALLQAALALAWLLGGGPEPTLSLPFGLPWLQAHFRLDALSAFFVLVVDGLAALVSLFAVGYGTHEAEPARALPFYPAFVAAMTLVLLADDAFSFLLSWESMSLASWLLVLSNHRDPATGRAAHLYLVMAAIGTAALLLAFGLLAGVAGDYGFAQIRASHLTPLAIVLVVLLTLVGAGSKAGLMPLHAWLPLAHPAAPSHVSALMSGAMTKVALYGLVRILFDLLGPLPWWPGAVLLAIGGLSAAYGVLLALLQRDLKTLLAFSTVENIGIVAIALGLALLFRADGLGALAALALAAALLHVVNHALLKGLLFCGAGAVLTATGLRDIERLGGLLRRLPVTGACFLIGAAGLAALPPLNGFASEWLLFQAVLKGTVLPQWELKFAVVAIGALLALAAALAAAVFVRAFGIAFLGRPRSTEAAAATEVDAPMRAGLIAMAAGCVLLGVLPSAALVPIASAAQHLLGAAPETRGSAGWLWLAPGGGNSYSGLIMLAVIAAITAALVLLVHRLASARLRRGPAWDCGFPDPRPDTQYSGASFAQPLRRVFGPTLLAARETVAMPAPGELVPARYEARWRDPFWDGLYRPVASGLWWLTERANVLQFFTIRRYLTLMFLALALLLAIVAVSQ